jgi:hypothetical protein
MDNNPAPQMDSRGTHLGKAGTDTRGTDATSSDSELAESDSAPHTTAGSQAATADASSRTRTYLISWHRYFPSSMELAMSRRTPKFWVLIFLVEGFWFGSRYGCRSNMLLGFERLPPRALETVTVRLYTVETIIAV